MCPRSGFCSGETSVKTTLGNHPFVKGENWLKNRKWPTARNGKELALKMENELGFGAMFLFFCHFWAIIPPFRATGHVLFFFRIFFSHFRLSARFPLLGGLTRNSRQVSVEAQMPTQISIVGRSPITHTHTHLGPGSVTIQRTPGGVQNVLFLQGSANRIADSSPQEAES